MSELGLSSYAPSIQIAAPSEIEVGSANLSLSCYSVRSNIKPRWRINNVLDLDGVPKAYKEDTVLVLEG